MRAYRGASLRRWPGRDGPAIRAPCHFECLGDPASISAWIATSSPRVTEMVAEIVRAAPLMPEPIGAIRRILLATDLSEASDAASVQAFDLARSLTAELVVVSVIDPATDPVTGLRGTPIDRRRDARLEAAQALVARGRHEGVRVSFLVWEGDPGEAIVEAATSEQVDLVVVGSHGRSGVGRMLLGSVSDFVVRRAPCPVLVVRGRPKA